MCNNGSGRNPSKSRKRLESDSSVPSVAAVTASHDPFAFQFNFTWRLQPPTKEIITDLTNIVREHLLFFYRKNNLKPERIIFFRDGVSEGEFEFVVKSEIQAIRNACMMLEAAGTYQPKLTFLVVQKRNHTRFFPIDKKDSEDRNFNVPPGTIVDTEITHPTAVDYYLVSHASIQGVARPTKYRKLWDDANMQEDELEELTYHLCHLFSRCTRAVSYPAPTYYAHLAAARAKHAKSRIGRFYVGKENIRIFGNGRRFRTDWRRLSIPEPDREAEEDVNSTVPCAICEDYGIVQPCGKCSVRIHTKCEIEIEDQVICSLCSRTDAIRDQRESAKTGLEKQAAKMLALSQQKLPPIKVGQNVVVKVPDDLLPEMCLQLK
ncbi:hypothetical protein RN001_008492 [Aquatica leii]|uniref:Piwi domain-containing protein n=1 Tax=Aquatica leii TaxID=1421715 RepID=A0AAN7PDC8_9COLE|nr:hypothetical protein RN001_008492 [Aquatica leii]